MKSSGLLVAHPLRLHDPAYASAEFGIGAQDDDEGSERAYTGPEVTELRLVVDAMDGVDAPGSPPAA